jgi:hypothetical protein
VLWDFYIWAGDAFQPSDLDLLGRTWGTEASAAAAMARVAPSMIADRDFLRWYAKVQRHFVPPDVAADLIRSAMDTDIRPVLPAIHVPTLVLARSWPGHEDDRKVAEMIDGSTFVLLDGEDRATFAGEQDDLVEAIREFVGAGSGASSAHTLLRAVLFTDIVGSTEHLARVGDQAWRELIVLHDDRSRRAVARHGGRLVKSTGDGILATFGCARPSDTPAASRAALSAAANPRSASARFTTVRTQGIPGPAHTASSTDPAGRTTAPAGTSSPARRRLAPSFNPFGTVTRSPSAVTSSCMKTVSAPLGIAAPVKMRMASPGLRATLVRAPAVRRPETASVVSPSARKSACRTA